MINKNKCNNLIGEEGAQQVLYNLRNRGNISSRDRTTH